MRRLSHPFSLSCRLPLSFSGAVKVACVYLSLLTVLYAYWGTAVAAASVESGSIPDDAIRIRIIAASDSPFDQQVKRDVRDRVADVIASWGGMPATHDEARALIASHLTDIQAAAAEALERWKVDYAADVTLADVPFPEKAFGGRAYAAGDYEALRITLGGGQGANWWCVLFPPLCLTAATAAEEKPARPNAAASAKAAGGKSSAEAAAGKGESASRSSSLTKDAGADRADADGSGEEEADKPKARFFLWELLQKLGDFLKVLFG